MSSPTLEWLRKNTRIYKNSNDVYNHVAATIAHPVARSLRPKTDVYTFNDGRTQVLLCLHGLISISYRNATYNIPVQIWFPLDYPASPPLVYVVPTNDMLITPSVHVDLSGLTSIPYIHNWKAKPEGCNVVALIEALQEHFSLLPPLYAKPKHSSPIPPPPPPPPRPSSIAQTPPPSASQPHHRYNSPPGPSQTPPRPPPPPFAALHQGAPLHPPIPTSTVPYSPNSQTSYQSPPPPPVPPPPTGPSPQQPAERRLYHHYSSPPTVATLSSISPPPPPPPFLPPTLLTHAHHHQVPVTVTPSASVVGGVRPPHPAPVATPAQPQQPSFSPAPKPPLPNLMDDPPMLSPQPIDTPEIVPPRPLNPQLLALHASLHQKFSTALQNLSTTHQSTFTKLLSLQSDLLKGPPAIADESARLEAVKDLCTTVARRVGDVVREAEGRIEDIKRRGETSVDELVCSSDVVYNQLIDLVAEDNAIEDTIYHLHRAHNAGRIDLEKFLRTTRALAEEQFMKRALIEKIVEETGLRR